jgi:biopolymer transport protein ExbB/TolQ
VGELFRAGGAVMIPLAVISVTGWWLALSCWAGTRQTGGPAKAARIETRLRMVSVCVTVLPLLGLLGTVSGMINTFGIIRSEGLGDPRLMAGGIREALVATECGLATAVPLLVFHQILSGRLRRGEIEHNLAEGTRA